jgi:hypothetical protein
MMGLTETISMHLYMGYPELDGDMEEEDCISKCEMVHSNIYLQRFYGSSFDFQIELGNYDVIWASEFVKKHTSVTP